MFECQSDAQCEGGHCERDGWCSFPDDACPSGRRYGGLAGDGLAGTCVPVDPTATGGTEDASGGPSSTSVTTASTSDPTSAPTSDPTTDPTTGSSDDDRPPSCGDGTVDADEDCDDGNMADGDGCDADCTPSGETIWEYVSGMDGPDVARDVAVFDGLGVVVCGDGADDNATLAFAALFSDDGDPISINSLDTAGSANAWGIAASDDLVVIGGRLLTRDAQQGFVVAQSLSGEAFAFAVPMAVYDVALADETVWVSGQNGSVPTVAAYTLDGDLVGGVPPLASLPMGGVVWDLALGGGGAIHMGGVDDETGTAWIASTGASDVLAWSTTWSMGSSGSAYGISTALDGAVIASGSSAGSGVIAVFEARDGAQRWSKQLVSDRGSFANVHKAAPGPSGEVVGVGWVSTSETEADIWVGKYSPEGELIWERTFAGTGTGRDSNGWGVAVDDAGFITAVGGILDATTGYDAWVVHLEP